MGYRTIVWWSCIGCIILFYCSVAQAACEGTLSEPLLSSHDHEVDLEAQGRQPVLFVRSPAHSPLDSIPEHIPSPREPRVHSGGRQMLHLIRPEELHARLTARRNRASSHEGLRLVLSPRESSHRRIRSDPDHGNMLLSSPLGRRSEIESVAYAVAAHAGRRGRRTSAPAIGDKSPRRSGTLFANIRDHNGLGQELGIFSTMAEDEFGQLSDQIRFQILLGARYYVGQQERLEAELAQQRQEREAVSVMQQATQQELQERTRRNRCQTIVATITIVSLLSGLAISLVQLATTS